jgi:hypothetical protein
LEALKDGKKSKKKKWNFIMHRHHYDLCGDIKI